MSLLNGRDRHLVALSGDEDHEPDPARRDWRRVLASQPQYKGVVDPDDDSEIVAEDVDKFVGRTIDELRDQCAVFLGYLIEHAVQQTISGAPTTGSSTFTVRGYGQQLTASVDPDDLAKVLDYGTWRMTKNGYVLCERWSEGKRSYAYLHRFVLGFEKGDPDVDHVNGNKLDNRRANLRVTNKPTNGANAAIKNGRGTSKYRGVYWSKQAGKWKAQQMVNRHVVHVGVFNDEDEAGAAVAKFREDHGLPPGHTHRSFSDRELAQIRAEAREAWIKKAAGVMGDPEARERLLAIGRGEVQ